jgi:hypothetical protein
MSILTQPQRPIMANRRKSSRKAMFEQANTLLASTPTGVASVVTVVMVDVD